MNMLYICCGFIGSGKTTWGKYVHNDSGAFSVSRDAIRKMIGCGEYIFNAETTEPIVKSIAHHGIRSLLKLGDVIVDETHLTKEKRREMIVLAHEEYAKPVIMWFTSTNGNVDRRMADDSRGYTKEKWQSVLEGMKKIFEHPTLDECEIIKIGIGE